MSSIEYNSPELISAVKRWSNQHHLLSQKKKKEIPNSVLKELTDKLSKTKIQFNKYSILKILDSL